MYKKCFEIPGFCKYIYIKVFISIKKALIHIHEGNFRVERIRNFERFIETLSATCVTLKKRAPCDTFSRNHEPNSVPEMSLSYPQYIPIFNPSGICKLLICSLEYCYRIDFVHNILYHSKGCLVHDKDMQIFFSALNFIIIVVSFRATLHIF